MNSLRPSALTSLDDSLAPLYGSFEKLRAAKSVDIAEVIQQLRSSAESSRLVRELVSSELPGASWQDRTELDALIDKIQVISEARALEQLRSRLLALATELERGSIVHRRAHRLEELNQLREQAISELRSHAASEASPQNLPGPQAGLWIDWACGLKEPQDAESLHALRNGFAQLDDFVANLEANMWIAAGSPISETLPEPERADDKTQGEQSRPDTESEADPQFPELLDELSQPASKLNAAAPNDDAQPQTEEALQRTLAQERALLASMMGLDSGPVRDFSGESPFVAEAVRQTTAAPETTSDLTKVEGPKSGKKWQVATAAVLTLVVLTLGAMQWRSRRNRTSNVAVEAVEAKAPELARSNAGDQVQAGFVTASAVHTAGPTTPDQQQSKAQYPSVPPNPLSKSLPAKQANDLNAVRLRAPAATPRNVALAKKEEPPPNGAADTPESALPGVPAGVPNNVASIVRDIPVAAPKIADQVRVSSGVAQGLLVHEVTPQYPPLARQARIQGRVVFQAVIGKDGTVQDLHVLSGHLLLIQAAKDAVRKWRYKPYYLNGEPVEANTQINVDFKLSGG